MKKVCVIGNGIHATKNIIPSLKEIGTSISAIASEYLKNENTFDGIKSYSNYKDMLEIEKPEIVVLCKSAEKQYEISKYCLNYGIEKLFVEKPMGMNVNEAKELEELAEKNNCKVMVGFMKRYSPLYIKMKEIINMPEFGGVKQFNAEFYITSGRDGWTDEIYLKKGGIHFVNILLWLFGEVEEVKTYSNSIDNNVSLTSLIKFKNGVVGNINFVGLTSWKGKRERITITGENGYVYNDSVRELHYHLDQNITRNNRWQTIDEEEKVIKPYLTSASGGVQDLYLHGYIGEMEEFINNDNFNFENVETMELIDIILNMNNHL